MKDKIKIIVDSSGSMGEISVSSVVKYILNILKNNFEISNIKYDIILINNEIKEIENIKEIKFFNQLKESILIDYILKNREFKIIFLTDGDFYIDEQIYLEEENDLYCLYFGEKLKFSLEKLTTSDKIFHCSEITNLIKKII